MLGKMLEIEAEGSPVVTFEAPFNSPFPPSSGPLPSKLWKRQLLL